MDLRMLQDGKGINDSRLHNIYPIPNTATVIKSQRDRRDIQQT